MDPVIFLAQVAPAPAPTPVPSTPLVPPPGTGAAATAFGGQGLDVSFVGMFMHAHIVVQLVMVLLLSGRLHSIITPLIRSAWRILMVLFTFGVFLYLLAVVAYVTLVRTFKTKTKFPLVIIWEALCLLLFLFSLCLVHNHSPLLILWIG